MPYITIGIDQHTRQPAQQIFDGKFRQPLERAIIELNSILFNRYGTFGCAHYHLEDFFDNGFRRNRTGVEYDHVSRPDPFLVREKLT